MIAELPVTAGVLIGVADLNIKVVLSEFDTRAMRVQCDCFTDRWGNDA